MSMLTARFIVVDQLFLLIEQLFLLIEQMPRCALAVHTRQSVGTTPGMVCMCEHVISQSNVWALLLLCLIALKICLELVRLFQLLFYII